MNAVIPLPAAPSADELIAAMPDYSAVLMRQVFRRRRLSRDDAQDLLQQTFLVVLEKIRSGGLEDATNLGGYLYRTAHHLTTLFWRREYRSHIESSDDVLRDLPDESPGPGDALKREQLAQSVRRAIAQLPVARDREVLARLYLHDESRVSIRESLGLTDVQFNSVVWRAEGRLALIFTNEENVARCSARVATLSTQALAARRSWGMHS